MKPNDSDVEAQALIARQAEKARKTNRSRRFLVVPFALRIQRFMDVNISLPTIKEWLEEQTVGGLPVIITVQTLRSFVVNHFGSDFYETYCARNGWSKSVHKNSINHKQSAIGVGLSQAATTRNNGNNIKVPVVVEASLSVVDGTDKYDQFREITREMQEK